MTKSVEGLRDLWDTNNWTNTCSVRELGEKGRKLPKPEEGVNIQIQVAQKRPKPRHIIIKLSQGKAKERILKTARKKRVVTYKGAPIRFSVNILAVTLQARRKWDDIVQVLKENKNANQENYLAKPSFRNEEEISPSQRNKS